MATILNFYRRDASPIRFRSYARPVRSAVALLSAPDTQATPKLEMRWSTSPDGRLIARWLLNASTVCEQFDD